MRLEADAGIFSRGFWRLAPALLFLALLAPACLGPIGPGSESARPAPEVFSAPLHNRLIAGVPFMPDDSSHCGPSTLAAVMTYQGTPATMDEVAAAVQREDLRGALGPDMVLYARSRGLDASFSAMSPDDLLDHITMQRPVILLLESAFGPARKGHFVVALGYGPEGLVVNSGLVEHEIIPWSRLLTAWLRSGNFAIVVRAPGDKAAPAPPAPDDPAPLVTDDYSGSPGGRGFPVGADYPAVTKGGLPLVSEALAGPPPEPPADGGASPSPSPVAVPAGLLPDAMMPAALQGADLPSPYPVASEPILNMTSRSRGAAGGGTTHGSGNESDDLSDFESHEVLEGGNSRGAGISEGHIGVPARLPVVPLPEDQPVAGARYGGAEFEGPATVPGASAPGRGTGAERTAEGRTAAGRDASEPVGRAVVEPAEPVEQTPVMGWER
ncbi:MAG: C39 family peptidase [Deltaproteobacteria bacterium]|jgi:hypothetical protein|nr:C39 family peptidase [Deltaproteobacteria bacterium]